jgi:hypothetical protein
MKILKCILEDTLLIVFWLGIVLIGIPVVLTGGLVYLGHHLPLWIAVVVCPVFGIAGILFQFYLMTGAHKAEKMPRY